MSCNGEPSSSRGTGGGRKRKIENISSVADVEADIEVTFEGTPEQNFRECKKNDGHEIFVPPSCLGLHHLQEYQFKELLEAIQLFADLTVHIKTSYVSEHRVKKDATGAKYSLSEYLGRCVVAHGSGYIFDVNYDNQLQSWKVLIVSAEHVVFDQKECDKTEVRCFSDAVVTKHKETILKGHKIKHKEFMSDFSSFECLTKDTDLVDAIKTLVTKKNNLMKKVNLRLGKMQDVNLTVVISFPHGHKKLVSFGKYHGRIERDSVLSFYTYSNPTCPGSSGGCVLIFKERENLELYTFAPHSCYSAQRRKNTSENVPTLKKSYSQSGGEISMML